MTNLSNSKQENITKKKKQSIPKKLKNIVWDTYIGNQIGQTKCLCCHTTIITMAEFDCGHVISEANGGVLSVDNLRPICRGCNLSMGTKSITEFQKICGFYQQINNLSNVRPQIGHPTNTEILSLDQNSQMDLIVKLDKSFSINDLRKILDILNIKYLKKSHKFDLINQIIDTGDQFTEIIQSQNNKLVINGYFTDSDQILQERYRLWNVFSVNMLENINSNLSLPKSTNKIKLINQLMIYDPKKIILGKLKNDKNYFNQNQLEKIANIIGIFNCQKNINAKLIKVFEPTYFETSRNNYSILTLFVKIHSVLFVCVKYVFAQIYWLYLIIVN